ncbi:hypothetical protein [Streptacidiphilus sp. P02-A3a]|uniref:hypothetical protein n=1 Tax=Streptacidiphilus sp. P02-A3a TaxID=2704468 RepID=UPI0015F93586|nr:hypothetical protein [Streptacidiphilus sp. P02-A3a]QMU70009.1 hypothetical protein GXP74_19040 [Streptacidiphilus sp. P02-A3a]
MPIPQTLDHYRRDSHDLDASQLAATAGGALRVHHPSAEMTRLLVLTASDNLLLGRPVGAVFNSHVPPRSPRREAARRPTATVLGRTVGAR